MFGRVFIIFTLVFYLTGCASSTSAWYTDYGISDKSWLTRKESIPKLIKALDDDRPEVRANASEYLGVFGPEAEDAINKLYVLRKNDNSGTVRSFAHFALKEICPDDYDGYNLRSKN